MKLNFAKGLVIGWVLIVLLVSLTLYIFCYPFPVKLNDEVRSYLISEIKNDSIHENDSIRISFLKNDVVNLVNKDGTTTDEDFQMFEYVVENDSSISTHTGWAELKKKTVGYKIVGVRLQ